MERLNLSDAHLATEMRSTSGMRPGSHLTIDGSGAFNSSAKGGFTQAFVFMDHESSYHSARVTTDRNCNTLVNEVKMWISHTGKMPETMWL